MVSAALIHSKPISGPLLCEKLLLFNQKLNGKTDTDFKPTIDWLKCLKTIHGIRQMDTEWERLSSDINASEAFKIMFKNFVKTKGFK